MWQWHVIRLDLKHRFTIANRSSDFRENIVVRYVNGSETYYGLAAPNPRYDESVETAISAIEILTQSAQLNQEPVTIWPLLNQAIRGQYAAKASIDMALYDAWGKRTNQPVWKLLRVPEPHGMPLCMTIGIDSAERVKQKVLDAHEFPILKVKLGGSNDREMIESIRSVTSKPLRVDANEGWRNREDAIREIEWLASRNTVFVEQPMPSDQLDDVIWLKQRSPLPLVADESLDHRASLPDLAQAYDGINIKLMKCGGITPALSLMGQARTLGLRIMLGCMVESSIGIAAAAQIAPLVDDLDLDGNLLIVNDPFRGCDVVDGHIYLNHRPGLGVLSKT
ncbi:MAG: dipeptide epimerase [Acidobacteria bacterium]|nr:dipeptide epimerase [Acidobacteriota bacterium]